MVKIDGFNFGFIVIDGKQYVNDVLILPDGNVLDRNPSMGRTGNHNISRNEIENLCKTEPEVVLLGCGTSWMVRLSESAEKYLQAINLNPIILNSSSVADKYNQLTSEGKRVAALIHVTC